MDTTIIVIIALIIVNIPLYILIGWAFFNSWQGFFDCLKFWLTPDVVSLFRGEYGEDRWSEMKLAVFVIACGAFVVGEFMLINKYFLN